MWKIQFPTRRSIAWRWSNRRARADCSATRARSVCYSSVVVRVLARAVVRSVLPVPARVVVIIVAEAPEAPAMAAVQARVNAASAEGSGRAERLVAHATDMVATHMTAAEAATTR